MKRSILTSGCTAAVLLLLALPVFGQRIIMVDSQTNDEVPPLVEVQEGDTLWGLCDHYLADARMWPTVWALNPHITNPHWIYPGDIIRMRRVEVAQEDADNPLPFNYTIGADGARQVSINEGFLVEKGMKPQGQLSYSPLTQHYLALDDLVYLEMEDLDAVRVGQKFSIYTLEHDVVHPETEEIVGTKIRIKGVVEIENVDKHMARAKIVAAFGEIERGMPVAELVDHYVVVNPKQNLIDLKGTLVDALNPNRELAEFDTVFLDLGAKDGVQVGNRLFIMRRGDGRYDYELDVNRKMPWEQIGEALVVLTRDRTATALITRSAIEIRRGDRVIMQRHY